MFWEEGQVLMFSDTKHSPILKGLTQSPKEDKTFSYNMVFSIWFFNDLLKM